MLRANENYLNTIQKQKILIFLWASFVKKWELKNEFMMKNEIVTV